MNTAFTGMVFGSQKRACKIVTTLISEPIGLQLIILTAMIIISLVDSYFPTTQPSGSMAVTTNIKDLQQCSILPYILSIFEKSLDGELLLQLLWNQSSYPSWVVPGYLPAQMNWQPWAKRKRAGNMLRSSACSIPRNLKSKYPARKIGLHITPWHFGLRTPPFSCTFLQNSKILNQIFAGQRPRRSQRT